MLRKTTNSKIFLHKKEIKVFLLKKKINYQSFSVNPHYKKDFGNKKNAFFIIIIDSDVHLVPETKDAFSMARAFMT